MSARNIILIWHYYGHISIFHRWFSLVVVLVVLMVVVVLVVVMVVLGVEVVMMAK